MLGKWHERMQNEWNNLEKERISLEPLLGKIEEVSRAQESIQKELLDYEAANKQLDFLENQKTTQPMPVAQPVMRPVEQLVPALNVQQPQHVVGSAPVVVGSLVASEVDPLAQEVVEMEDDDVVKPVEVKAEKQGFKLDPGFFKKLR